MSAQPESVGTPEAAEKADAVSGVDHSRVDHSITTQDSLSMFLAAIGGAILGMLLTLLVLALVNGGTLSFSGPRITQLEEYVSRVDENVGSVSANINLVSEQAASLQQQLGSVETALRNEIDVQGGDISTINDTLATLEVTQQQFDLFTSALGTALADMQALDPNAASATETAAQDESATEATEADTTETEAAETTATESAAESATESAAETTEPSAPQVASSEDVAADAIAVLLFVDEDGDGLLGDMETNLVGMPVALLDDEGATLATEESTDAGVLFPDLAAGTYEISVEDTLGYTLLTTANAAVEVAEDAEEGTVVYLPVAAE